MGVEGVGGWEWRYQTNNKAKQHNTPKAAHFPLESY